MRAIIPSIHVVPVMRAKMHITYTRKETRKKASLIPSAWHT